MFVAEIDFHSKKNNFVYVFHTEMDNNNYFDPKPVCLSVDPVDEVAKSLYLLGYLEKRFFKSGTDSACSLFCCMQINPMLATKFGLKLGDKVSFKIHKSVPKCQRMSVELETADDWEIVESNAEKIEYQLLNQIRIISKGLVFPVWIDESLCIFFRITSVEPDSTCVMLYNDTVLNIAPFHPHALAGILIPKEDKNSTVEQESNEDKFQNCFDLLLDQILQYCRLNLAVPSAFCGHVSLEGPAGSGTTTVAESVARAAVRENLVRHSKFFDCKSLNGKSLESVVKLLGHVFDACFSEETSILILDDLDQLCSAPSSTKQLTPGAEMHFVRLAQVLIKFLDCITGERIKCICIATCKSKAKLHPSLISARCRRYFTKNFKIPPLNLTDQHDLLGTLINNKSMKFSDKSLIDRAMSRTNGCVVGDLVRLVDRISAATSLNQIPSESGALIQISDLNFALEGFQSVSLHAAKLTRNNDERSTDDDDTLHSADWSDFGGSEHLKFELKRIFLWPSKYCQIYKLLNIRMSGGLLLYGPTGTGKTFLASLTAKMCNLNCIVIKGAELLSKYIGASEEAVRNTFDRARSVKPSMILFDEFDALAPRRGHDSTGVTDRVVNQLLTELDGVEPLDGVYVLATSSRPDLIDPAFLRPGRIGQSFYCGLPKEEDRFEILQAMCQNLTFDRSVDVRWLAGQTGKFSGADLKSLLYTAQLMAFERRKIPPNDSGGLYPTNTNTKNFDPINDTFRLVACIPDSVDSASFKTISNEMSKIFNLPKMTNCQLDSNGNEQASNAVDHVTITEADFRHALQRVKPSVPESEISRFRRLKKDFNPAAAKRPSEQPEINEKVGSRLTLA